MRYGQMTMTQIMVERLFACVFCLLVLAAPLSSSAAEASPHEVIRGTSEQLVTLIEEARGYVDESPERYHSEVQALLDPIVDFRSFSRLVMASHYKRATVEQRKRFANSFKLSLIHI